MSINREAFLKKYQSQLSSDALSELKNIFSEMNFLQTAFDANPCTISLIDEKGQYVNANVEMLKLVNTTKEKFLGTQLGEITKDVSIKKLIQDLKNSDETSKHLIIDTVIENQRKVFFITANKVGDQILTTGLDITATKDLEEEKLFNDKMAVLGEMSSFIVHEINNPLSGISMATELIQFRNEDPDDASSLEDLKKMNEKKAADIKKYSDQISETITVISKIIDSLKTVTRKPTKDCSAVSLQSVFERSKTILSGKLKKQRIKITSEGLDKAVFMADEGDLIQVMVNLISNSVDAIQNIEDKWISVKWVNDELVLTDSGLGIPDSIVPNLFKKFHTSKGDKGNGIGLYLSRDLLKKWGYDLVYRLDGKNTSFVLSKQ